MRIVAIRLLILTGALGGSVLAQSTGPAPGASDWPMLARDAARSGFAPEAIEGPFQRAWFKDFERDEQDTCSSDTQVIIADGAAYIATCGGTAYALDAATGKERWRAKLGGAVFHSAGAGGGRVFFGTLQRGLVALSAKDGAELWTFPTGPGGVWNAPLLVGGRVIFGSRDGNLYAVEADSGKLAWKLPTGGPILNSPASDGQTVYVGSEDMCVYAASLADGRQVWKSEPLQGQSLRHYHPVVDAKRGLIFLTSTPAIDHGKALSEGNYAMLRPFGFTAAEARQGSWAIERTDRFKQLKDKLTSPAAETLGQERDGILQMLREQPGMQTFFVLDARTGKQAATMPILYQGGCSGSLAPPVLAEDGTVYVLYRTIGSQYIDWGVWFACGAVGRLDVEKALVSQVPGGQGRQWGWFWIIGDEQTTLTACRNAVFIPHSMAAGGVRTDRPEAFTISPGRDKLGGLAGRLGMENTQIPVDSHSGPGRAGVVVANGMAYWTVGSAVVAFKRQ